MFYQNILTEISPYQARVGEISDFGEHRHADIELNFCLEGCLDAYVNKKRYSINQGEILLISPMVAHSYPRAEKCRNKSLCVIVGVSFLKKFFSYFSQAKRDAYVIDKDCSNKLFEVLSETAQLCEEKNESNDLLIRGNLYKCCSYLIDVITSFGETEKCGNKEMVKVANIEKALEMIYYDHALPLTIEDAAMATGYGKSNFCKIFKAITGDTFHNVLNRQRVESASALLSETDMPISEIAHQVGFVEAKAFYRIFKSLTALTPGQYRKNQR